MPCAVFFRAEEASAEAAEAPVEEPPAELAGEPGVANAAVKPTGSEEEAAEPASAVEVETEEEEPIVAAVEEDAADAGEGKSMPRAGIYVWLGNLDRMFRHSLVLYVFRSCCLRY